MTEETTNAPVQGAESEQKNVANNGHLFQPCHSMTQATVRLRNLTGVKANG